MKIQNYEVVRSTYSAGGIYLGLVDDDGEYCNDITVCIPEVSGNTDYIVFDHNLKDYSPELYTEAKEMLTEGESFPWPQGFVVFEVRQLKKGILEEIKELK